MIPTLYPDLCIDLETLSTRNDAVIIEIGAVVFDAAAGTMGDTFTSEVSMADQHHRRRSPETVAWWEKQKQNGNPPPGITTGKSLKNAVRDLDTWIRGRVTTDVRAWSWGIVFDIGILESIMHAGTPWKYHNVCDARTYCFKLGIKRQGPTVHRALPDAVQEARAVIAAEAKLNHLLRTCPTK